MICAMLTILPDLTYGRTITLLKSQILAFGVRQAVLAKLNL